MRKLYALLAGMFFSIAIPTLAQTPADVAGFNITGNASSLVSITNTSVIDSTFPGIRKALWNFGDGSTQLAGALDNIQHQYTAPGTYTICLKILLYRTNTSEPVVTSDICKTVVVESVCRADFERLPASSANPRFVTLKALPWHSNQNKPVLICWQFGDGKDTCIQYSNTFPGPYTVNHEYNHAGEYEVCVKIVYQGGCDARKCKEVRVLAPDSCTANFERLPVSSTADFRHATFKALPWHNNNKKPKRICWIFGDGRDTCITYGADYTGNYLVSHFYQATGEYQVCVNILYDGGCESNKCKGVQIARPDSCAANFERLPTTNANHPLTATFKALPFHNNNKKPKRICWTFGDGRDTCINYLNIYNGPYTVSHTYNQPGNYRVCVRIAYFGDCVAEKCRELEIGHADSCRADFERIPATAVTNTLITAFRALTWNSDGKKPARICWTFGDGRDTCINYGADYNGSYTAGHTYTQAGEYDVCVKILYYGGCEAYKCRKLIVLRPDECKADFEKIPATTSTNLLTAAFRAQPWHNNNKKPKRICWTFGDGRDTCISYGADYNGPYTVTHTYSQAGEYQVCVKILYDGGCEAYKCERIAIPFPACSVNVWELATSANNTERTLAATVHSTPQRPVERICWNFGDGQDTCIVGSAGNPVDLGIRHQYPGPGVYRACVSVLFAGGCVANDCEEIVIRGNTDRCGGYMTDSLVALRTFKFRGFSIHQANDEVLSYRWTFGDGTSANGPEALHTYATAGEYRVCLTIITRSGCETQICNTVRMPGANTPRLVLSPNPATSVLHAVFNSTHTETVTVKLINSNGVVIRTVTRNAVAGVNTWDFEVGSLQPGYYSLLIQSPNQTVSALFLKQ